MPSQWVVSGVRGKRYQLTGPATELSIRHAFAARLSTQKKTLPQLLPQLIETWTTALSLSLE
jgi:hypothetical protein